MAFVGLGGTGALRPTYFELLAADQLTPALKAAAIYSLSVSCDLSYHIRCPLHADLCLANKQRKPSVHLPQPHLNCKLPHSRSSHSATPGFTACWTTRMRCSLGRFFC